MPAPAVKHMTLEINSHKRRTLHKSVDKIERQLEKYRGEIDELVSKMHSAQVSEIAAGDRRASLEDALYAVQWSVTIPACVMCIRAFVYIGVCTGECVYGQVCIRAFVCIGVCTGECVYGHVCIRVFVYIGVCTGECVYGHVCIRVFVYIGVCTGECVYGRLCIRAHTHTGIHSNRSRTPAAH
jgi:hypothetical protein